MKAIFSDQNESSVRRVYPEDITARLGIETGLDGKIYTKEMLLADKDKFKDVQYIFSTWDMPVMTEEEIRECLPELKAVFYAAGSVQYFARPFLNCGVKVFSAWAANAIPVAEYTVAQIILANKGFYQTSALASSGRYNEAMDLFRQFDGNYGAYVGIIGAGMIGKLVIKMLKEYRLNVMVFDPFLPDEAAAELGVEKTDLKTLFSKCKVVSNHLANNEQTRGMLCGELFASMPENAVFINTGRGAQVVEADLVKVLTDRPDLTAVLDVTYPEPPQSGHGFYKLQNCILTPHIAGSSGSEVHRMAEYMLEEYLKYSGGEQCRYEVTEKMLETMA